MKDLNSLAFQEQFAIRQRLDPDAVPTHLPALNAMMHDDGGQQGFGRGWFICLAGLTGHGKSITALNFSNAALPSFSWVAAGLCWLD